MTVITRYETRVVAVGPLVPDFVNQGVLVLFAENAPPELHEFSILHRPQGSVGKVRPGDIVVFGSDSRTITAVGEVANENLEKLGHAVFKCNGRTTPDLPGDICLDAGELPELEIGDRISVEAGDE